MGTPRESALHAAAGCHRGGMRTRLALAAPVLALALAACSGGHGSVAKAPATASPTSAPVATPAATQAAAAVVQTQGSVRSRDGSFVRYPTGLEVRVVAVERIPPQAWGAQTPRGYALVRVTLAYRNRTARPMPLDDGYVYASLLYGAEQQDVDAEGGHWVNGVRAVTNYLPRRFPARTTLRLGWAYTVPVSGLRTLAVATNNGQNLTPYTFTDAETMLRTSKGI